VTFHEAGVQGAGILRVKKCFLQFWLGAKQESTIYSNYPILPPFLDYLAVNANASQQPLHCSFIHLESIGCEQEAVFNMASLYGVQNPCLDVSEVAAAE